MGHRIVIAAGNRVESYEYQKYPQAPRRGATRSKRGYRKAVVRRPDNARRMRNSFRRLVAANLAGGVSPALVTLTVDRVVSFKTAYSYLKTFFGGLRKHGLESLRYISVVEFQQRGALHFHVLVWGLPDTVILHEGSRGRGWKGKVRWFNWMVRQGYTPAQLKSTRNLQRIWARGFLDITPTDGSLGLATYMAKYLFKSVLDPRLGGEKAYSASRNVMRPMRYTGKIADFYMEGIDGVQNPLRESEYDTKWLGTCQYRQYELNSDV